MYYPDEKVEEVLRANNIVDGFKNSPGENFTMVFYHSLNAIEDFRLAFLILLH